MRASSAYAKAQQETASKERLMVMLFEAAQKHMRAGAGALSEGRPVEGHKALVKASDIVVELLATLNPAVAPELCKQLSAVYEFVLERLSKAMAEKDAKAAQEAERAFAPLVEAFSQAVVQVSRPAEAGR